MKKAWPIIVIALVVLVAGGIVLANRGSKNNATTNSETNKTTSTTPSNNQSASNSSESQVTNKVTISNFSFSPADITVKKGATVTWTNQDSTAHTVMETDGKDGPKSQDLNQGQTYSFTYNTVGTFAYHCSVHPSMTGTVTVTE
jgi:plastocyanin